MPYVRLGSKSILYLLFQAPGQCLSKLFAPVVQTKLYQPGTKHFSWLVSTVHQVGAAESFSTFHSEGPMELSRGFSTLFVPYVARAYLDVSWRCWLSPSGLPANGARRYLLLRRRVQTLYPGAWIRSLRGLSCICLLQSCHISTCS